MINYQQIFGQIATVKSELMSNINLDYLLPQEEKLLESLPFFPKESIPYFGRFQALGLLDQLEIGIILEQKFKSSQKQI